MIDKIFRLKDHLCASPFDREHVVLSSESSEDGTFVLRGRAIALVLPLLDGHTTVDAVARALAGEVSPVDVLYAVAQLEAGGHLTEARPGAVHRLTAGEAAFWSSLGLDPDRAAEHLAATPVSLRVFGDARPGAIAELVQGALANAGVRVEGGASVTIAVTDDDLAPALDALNRAAIEHESRWILLRPSGRRAWIGPAFGARGGPCWECLAHRLRARLGLARLAPQAPVAATPASLQAACALAAITVARWIGSGQHGALDDHLVAFDFATLASTSHAVVRRPQCPACGDPTFVAKRAFAPLVLTPRAKRSTDDGGHRAATAAETVTRLEPLVSPITGVIAAAGPVPGRDHPLRPVHAAAYRIAHAGPPSIDALAPTSLGKGRTPEQTRASALSEAIERASAVFQGDEARVRARFVDLGDEAVHPDRLQGFSAAQLRAASEARVHARDRVEARPRREGHVIPPTPLPFDPERAIDWTPVWCLNDGRRRLVPTAYAYLRTPVPPEERFCAPSSNGHAAGSCLEEAIVQGFFELVERDAVALWWYSRARRPAVELPSFEDAYFDALAAHYASLGHAIDVLDVTTDLGLPAFVAVSRAKDTGRVSLGFGCHADARLGVQRALTELNQLFEPARREPAAWESGEDGDDDRAFLAPDPSQRPRRRDDFQAVRTTDLRDDVLDCVARAAAVGLETLVLDQTRPDLVLSAVKVIVPGLRHFWPRLGPGRLYDIPPVLGWIPARLTETELNPVGLFL